jgi:tetratricopeptide (TPR) repeat protein
VMDFGLARGAQRDSTEPDHDTDAKPHRRHLDATLTRVGAIPGTPAYMAPEQISGDLTDARTDQFAFCVMLWEALYGERPFESDTLIALASNILAGNRRLPPRGISIPRWLRAVMHRGLAIDVSDRWPSLTVMLGALDRGRRRARVVRAFTGIGVVALGIASVLAVRNLDEQGRIAACDEAGASLGDVWNDDAREAVRAGLFASKAEHAATTANKVMPWLDAQADAWRTARIAACLDADVYETWDDDMLDRSVWCLDERRMELEALVTELRDADRQTVTTAVTAAAGLRRIEPCRDVALLQRLPPPPSEAREAVRAVRAELSKAAALQATAAYDDGLAEARRALEHAVTIQWPPLRAAAEFRVGSLLESTGAYEDAATKLEAAYFEAAKTGALEQALLAADQLVFTVGYRLRRFADAERWSRHAEVVRAALPDPAGLREASSLHSLANAYIAEGRFVEAVRLHERALAIREAALASEHPDIADSLNNLAAVHYTTGAYAEAGKLHERALAIRETTLGGDHPLVATSLDNLGNVQSAWGRHAAAAVLHARALAIKEKALGNEHSDVALTLVNLAAVRQVTGRPEEAAALYERALAINEKALGADHPQVAMTLNNLATVRYAMKQSAEAAKLHERALAIREKALGADHPDVAQSLTNLASIRYVMGEYAEAARLYERSLIVWEKAFGPVHPNSIHSLLGLGRVALAQQRAGDAVSVLERAVEVGEASESPVIELAVARLLLAQALVSAGEPEERAIALATQARDAFRDAGRTQLLTDTELFLREHAANR